MPYLVHVGALKVVVHSPGEADRVRNQLVGDNVPEIRVTDMDGVEVDLEAALQAIRDLGDARP